MWRFSFSNIWIMSTDSRLNRLCEFLCATSRVQYEWKCRWGQSSWTFVRARWACTLNCLPLMQFHIFFILLQNIIASSKSGNPLYSNSLSGTFLHHHFGWGDLQVAIDGVSFTRAGKLIIKCTLCTHLVWLYGMRVMSKPFEFLIGTNASTARQIE